jgi:uncharacterized protein YndB with AHSA1/START domain
MRILAVLLVFLCALPLRAADQKLVHEGIVEGPVDAVWKAFTTKEGIEAWMVAKGEFELKIGGKMRSVYNPKAELGGPQTIENTILSFEPGRMLSIKNTKAPEGFPHAEAIRNMWTVIYFDEAGADRTRVRIVGMGFGEDAASQQLRKHFDGGNAYTLKKLQEHFAKQGK